jgi:hypothetical protein
MSLKKSQLVWFVGFAEAKASFFLLFNCYGFILHHREPKILQKIYKILNGRGSVTKSAHGGCKVLISPNNLNKLILVFVNPNSGCALANSKLNIWLQIIGVYSFGAATNLNNPQWVSGYIDGEGFYGASWSFCNFQQHNFYLLCLFETQNPLLTYSKHSKLKSNKRILQIRLTKVDKRLKDYFVRSGRSYERFKRLVDRMRYPYLL